MRINKKLMKPCIMMGPCPVVMVSCGDYDNANIITVAWCGVACSQPPKMYISVRPERYSYDLIKNSGEFVINLTPQGLTAVADFCGFRSGRDCDKFEQMKLTKVHTKEIDTALIGECPINIECKVDKVIPLGCHDMFIADVVAVHVDDNIITDKGKVAMDLAKLISSQHGEYYGTGKHIGRLGFAVQKKFIKENGKGVNVDINTATLTKRKQPKKYMKKPKVNTYQLTSKKDSSSK